MYMFLYSLLGTLSKLKNLCARTFFALLQPPGENPMSHFMSPVFRFQLEAELRLKLCAEPKNMANSTLKCHFKVALSGNLYLRAHQDTFGRAISFLVDFYTKVMEVLLLGVQWIPATSTWYFATSNKFLNSDEEQQQRWRESAVSLSSVEQREHLSTRKTT